MDWKLMEKPANKQNHNVANGGDIVKHTVYLATLDFLLRHPPWDKGMRLRECHAGRGIYHVDADHKSRAFLSCLHTARTKGEAALLQRAQRSILTRLGCWPATPENVEQHVEWYAGSALINAHKLADHPATHELDLYESNPETRKILHSVLLDLQLPSQLSWRVPSGQDDTKEFDGEECIEQEIDKWGVQDVIFLDPFAMWLSAEDQERRARYGRILDSVARRERDGVSLILFWVWGSWHQNEAGEDLSNMARDGIDCGYHGLRNKLHGAGVAFLRVKWFWGQWFAMWIVVPRLPGAYLAELEERIQKECRLAAVLWKRCGHKCPKLEIEVDSP